MKLIYSTALLTVLIAAPVWAADQGDNGKDHSRASKAAIEKKPLPPILRDNKSEDGDKVKADVTIDAENVDEVDKIYQKLSEESRKKSKAKDELTDNGENEKIAEVEKKDEAVSAIGETEVITAEFEDTLLELGRKYNLGYVEMVAANPGVDPWVPGDGTQITLPKQHLLPDAPREGLVINLAEMRMYNFVENPNYPKTYPLGIGRNGLNTPLGETTIVRKKDGPSWRPTPRMRKADPTLPAVVPPGEDNPLGTHALYLGWPQYLIHGTHKPLGVGRRVSSGCIRMYPEDIVKVFAEIPNGTKVTVIKQPIKFAWIDDMLFMEAHAEDELADTFENTGTLKEYRVPETLFADVTAVAGEAKDRLDWAKIRDAVKTRNGMPIAILTDKEPDEPVEVSEDILEINVDEVKPIQDEDHKPVKAKKQIYNLNS